MRSVRGWVGVIALLVFVFPASSAKAQCEDGTIQLRDAIELRLLGKPLVDPNRKATVTELKAEAKKEATRAAVVETNAEVPLTMASATQVEAPSTVSGSSLVSLPGIVSLLGVAQEQGLVNTKDGVTSISLTPFSFLALVRPEYVSNQELYMKASNLRRWGGTLAFGGKGDSFDRDGDGKPDEALETKDYNDIVTWEVKYQIGSRDRREKENFEIFDKVVRDSDIDTAMFSAMVNVLTPVNEELERKGLITKENAGCVPVAEMEKALDNSGEMVKALKAVDDAYTAAAKDAFARVDAKPTLTLVVGGTEKAEGFGADKRTAALRGAFPLWGGTNAAELSWSQVEDLVGDKDPTTLKLGWQYSRNFLKGSALSKDGVTLAVAGSYEEYRDVPTVTHDTISKVNAKLSVPVTEGVEIPISVTWANHADLLTDEEEIQGHIGFTVDYSKVRDQILGRKK